MTDSLQAKIAAMQQEYLQVLVADLDMLVALRSELDADHSEQRTFVELRDLAHRISGSAGSFGYETLGKAAHEVDRLLAIEVPEVQTLLVLVDVWLEELRRLMPI